MDRPVMAAKEIQQRRISLPGRDTIECVEIRYLPETLELMFGVRAAVHAQSPKGL